MKRRTKIALALLGWLIAAGGVLWLLNRRPSSTPDPAFILSVGIFLVVFTSISFRWMHETAAAMLGAVAVWLFHYVGGRIDPSLQLIGFEESMTFVDWNVVFLILGMMILIALTSETGIFGWLAYRSFRLAKGNAWLLGITLITLTGLISAFLNDVTAILLLVPLSIQIAQTVGISPFAYVIPMVLASNIGGAATLIGDPPSTIVGSHIGLGFLEYMVNMVPVAVLCMFLLLGLVSWLYRKEYFSKNQPLSSTLVAQLENSARIRDTALLRKAGAVGLLTLILFFIGDLFGLPPSVIALTGAALLITWVKPDMHHMLREVDWTTLLFFIGIFIVVGGLEKSGVLNWLAGIIDDIAGNNLDLATILIVWVPGIASGIVANIPFTVAALPIADFLTASIPGSGNQVLYWGLILGADLGGNSTYIGSAPNIVALGLLAQAGYPLTFGRFMRDGVPVTFLTLIVATLWLLVVY